MQNAIHEDCLLLVAFHNLFLCFATVLCVKDRMYLIVVTVFRPCWPPWVSPARCSSTCPPASSSWWSASWHSWPGTDTYLHNIYISTQYLHSIYSYLHVSISSLVGETADNLSNEAREHQSKEQSGAVRRRRGRRS